MDNLYKKYISDYLILRYKYIHNKYYYKLQYKRPKIGVLYSMYFFLPYQRRGVQRIEESTEFHSHLDFFSDYV
jgi:hypothetical protein